MSNTDCCSLADAKLTHSSKLLSAQAHGVLRDLPGRSHEHHYVQVHRVADCLVEHQELPASVKTRVYPCTPTSRGLPSPHLTQNFTRTFASQRGACGLRVTSSPSAS